MRALPRSARLALFHCLVLLQWLLPLPTQATLVAFENCLSPSYLNQSPKRLQLTPLFVNATFDGNGTTHSLNLTIYGNVSGQQFVGDLPPPDSPYWNNDSDSTANGKIVNLSTTSNKLSTLTALYSVLTYSAYDNKGEEFCGSLEGGYTCPLAPAFNVNASDPNDLPRFNVRHDFGSSYAFSTISSTIHVIGADTNSDVACISVQITPDLGPNISALITWLPAAILILKGIATLMAAIWSPWGSSDIFRWSSNYGRDEDLLRLVTPGFGDCLQYIQFIVLTGSLTLQYPGFYQPAVSQASWSTLLFNESFVSGGNGTVSLIDGLYNTDSRFGLNRMSQLVGMSEEWDIWACMAVWLVVIAVAVALLCQLGFFGRWIYRMATNTTEEDLRQKNLPFTLGNIIRLLFNYFILPIVALSLFQLVIASKSPASVVACAVVLLLLMVGWAAWILRVIFRTKPRTLLFDDMPTVLLYGPLYNTYSDSAAPFALIPVFITFMRGVAIGAIQPSGIAQVIVLAICEVILILTLNGFRPFQGQTSMNLYHTAFSSVRLATILLMIAFVPSLGVTEAPRGWIGYVILLLHACVLVFGFFLNAMQTIIEVILRALGAGHDAQNGAIRGSVLSGRMLKKRQNRLDQGDRSSMMSSAAILRDGGANGSVAYGGRSRSISGSSHQLLNRMSHGFENFSSANENLSSPDPDSGVFGIGTGTMTTSSNGNSKPVIPGGKEGENYYRPPRQRKATLELMATPGTKTRSTADFPYQDSPMPGHARDASYDSGAFGSPAPAYLRARHDSEGNSNAPRTDYAVREVDQYYRGPALNGQPSRKLKTGPADPEGPASTAQTWLSRLVFGVKGGKKKDQSKGFEVVRSARMPPGMQQEAVGNDAMELQTSPVMHEEPYRDAPDTPGRIESPTEAGAERSLDSSPSPIADRHAAHTGQSFDFGFSADRTSRISRGVRPDSETIGAFGHPGLDPISTEHRASMGMAGLQRRLSEETMESRFSHGSSRYPDEEPTVRYSDQPVPMLDPVNTVGDINLPSRFNSSAGSHVPSRFNSNAGTTQEQVPSRMTSNRSGGAPSVFDGGQEWLQAVDNLDWNPSRQPSARSQQPPPSSRTSHDQQSFQAPPPTVPRRSSRRTLSQEHAAQMYQPRAEDIFENFDSNGEPSPDLLSGSPVDERPPVQNRTHRVVHHRAADSITRNSFGANAAMNASSAEYFSPTPPRSRDQDRE